MLVVALSVRVVATMVSVRTVASSGCLPPPCVCSLVVGPDVGVMGCVLLVLSGVLGLAVSPVPAPLVALLAGLPVLLDELVALSLPTCSLTGLLIRAPTTPVSLWPLYLVTLVSNMACRVRHRNPATGSWLALRPETARCVIFSLPVNRRAAYFVIP